MQFSFDLISDLHIETWPNFDWTDQPTSPYCLVLGDVARDREILRETLKHLGQCYKGGVFYIDGNDEHRHSIEDLGSSYMFLNRTLEGIENVVYLQDNVVIINGVAILATNGWWGFDFDPALDYTQSQQWYCDRMEIIDSAADAITGISFNDTAYMLNSVSKLQYHKDVRAIVCATHTVPAPWIVNHDIDLVDTWRFNVMGNQHMQNVLGEDTENKIKAWCFGHYHKSVDRDHNGVRYVNNCRGRGDTDWCQSVYYPKRITIEY
jgi:UDP-2,3-diacylglucosamine pyrophosphatase LpxH